MTLFPMLARTNAAPARDRSVAVILFLLLALVFVPVVGLHIAFAASGLPHSAQPAPDGVAHAPTDQGARG
ncbi:MAG TPA: hypothetical protein VHG30_06010 [Microvirga sp.]|jgi:nitrate reductase NapE component|nr:hypothetical protein [Microvirga sp.]